jgi:hypothetical protein
MGATVAEGWALFIDSVAPPRWLERSYSVAWIVLLFIVPGACAYRLAPTLTAVALMGSALVGLPGWLGLASVPTPLVLTAILAFAAGWSLRLLVQQELGLP